MHNPAQSSSSETEALDSLYRAYEACDFRLCLSLASQILTHSPNNVEAWFICAMSLYYLGDIARAIDYLLGAHQIAPKREDIIINLAELLRLQNRAQEAIRLLQPFLPTKNPNLYFNLARALSQVGDRTNAIKAYQEVLKITPDDTDAAYNLANLYAEEGAYTQAIALYKTCPTLKARFNLAQTYTLIDDTTSALALYKALESNFVPRPKAQTESETAYQEYQQSRAEFYFNYANAMRYAGRSREAERFYQMAYTIMPSPLYVLNYAHLLLSVGVFERGFSYYQERLRLPKQEMDNTRFFTSPKHIATLQNPEQIRERIKNARVLIFYEQGFGDSLMFGRFIDMLVCAKKFVYVQGALQSLFALHYEIVGNDFEDFDYCISFPSLPYVLQITLVEDFMHNAMYLRNIFWNIWHLNFRSNLAAKPFDEVEKSFENDVESNIRHTLQDAQNIAHSSSLGAIMDSVSGVKLGISNAQKQLKIGLFFHSNPHFAYANYKSIKLSILIDFFKRCAGLGLDFTLHCVQPEPLESIADKQCVQECASSIQALEENAIELCRESKDSSLNLYTYPLHNFLDAARVVRQMDIVVSVDSAVAHLAIALGVPCATLVYKRYDWRWGELGRTRFQGFCGGEVFAQSVYGDWRNVLQELEVYLLNFTQA